MSKMPTDAEIQAAGTHLGHGPGPYPTKLRAQLAKVVQEAERMEVQERAAEVSTGQFADRIADTYQTLAYHPKLSATVAESVVAAIAPQIYRDTIKENTAQ